MKSEQWTTYRTRFLVKAKQLSSALSFVDSLGRQHAGRKGDYLVESSDGVISIAPRQIFEDIYVAMSPEEAFADESAGVEPNIARENFAELVIEKVKLRKQPMGRQHAVDSNPHDEAGRVRRKLPQPCRDRRGSATHLGLM